MSKNYIYTDYDENERYKIFLIEYLIGEKKSFEFIKNQLTKYGFYEGKKDSQLKNYILEHFNFIWNSTKKKWEKQADQISWFKESSMKINPKLQMEYMTSKESNPYKIVKISRYIKIPQISQMEVACAFLLNPTDVTISSNDAETIMKNISRIEGKLNQIARAIDRISKVISEEK